MKINPILSVNLPVKTRVAFTGKKDLSAPEAQDNSAILEELDLLAQANLLSSVKPKYALGLDHSELLRRTSEDALYTYKMLDIDSPEYLALDEGDKKALLHLLRAGEIIDEIELEIDDSNNIPFRDFLNSKINSGDKDAQMAKTLFDAQKGIFSLDNEGASIALAEGLSPKDGLGLYPSDLSVEEFHSILIKMLKEGKRDEVAAILNQRSFVERDNDELKAVDYIDKFKKEFNQAADELEKAAETSTNEDFNEFLKLQAVALRKADPMLDACADIKWAGLQDTPLEFTITREGYDDVMTTSVFDNEELSELLKKNKIDVYSKDCIGARIGIVNKESTDRIIKIKDYLPIVAENMPLADTYEQDISRDKETKQAMVDADIVNVFGDAGACRAGVYAAENLPNDDKMSINSLNGGKRNVYHRQVMLSADKNTEKILKALVDPKLHKYYGSDANLLFTVGHENGHTLGPEEGGRLGRYSSTIEENKADLTSILMADILNKEGFYSDDIKNQILLYFVVDNILKAKPLPSQAHRMRSLMQMNYLIEEGAVSVLKDGILTADLDKVAPAACKMLRDVIEIQLSGDPKRASDFIERYAYWSEDSEKMAQTLRKILKSLNARIEAPLSDKLLSEKCAH